ncbi:MAG: MucR family transcriptional regulator, partial [Novosphingobium sp.]
MEEYRKPAVAVRTSVKPDAIARLECGVRMKDPKRRLGSDYWMTPAGSLSFLNSNVYLFTFYLHVIKVEGKIW